MRRPDFFSELKRRNVYKVAVAYIADIPTQFAASLLLSKRRDLAG